MAKGAEVIREDPLIPELPSVCFLLAFWAVAQKPIHWWALWSDKKCIVQSPGNQQYPGKNSSNSIWQSGTDTVNQNPIMWWPKQKGESCEPAPVSHGTAVVPQPSSHAPSLHLQLRLLHLCSAVCCSTTCFVTAAVNTYPTMIFNSFFFHFLFFNATPFPLFLTRDKFLTSLSAPGSSPFPGAALPLRIPPWLHLQVFSTLVPSMPHNRDEHHSPNQ